MPQQTEKKTVRTTVSIPAEDHAELERIAEQKKVSVAWVVRDAIERYLNEDRPQLRRK